VWRAPITRNYCKMPGLVTPSRGCLSVVRILNVVVRILPCCREPLNSVLALSEFLEVRPLINGTSQHLVNQDPATNSLFRTCTCPTTAAQSCSASNWLTSAPISQHSKHTALQWQRRDRPDGTLQPCRTHASNPVLQPSSALPCGTSTRMSDASRRWQSSAAACPQGSAKLSAIAERRLSHLGDATLSPHMCSAHRQELSSVVGRYAATGMKSTTFHWSLPPLQKRWLHMGALKSLKHFGGSQCRAGTLRKHHGSAIASAAPQAVMRWKADMDDELSEDEQERLIESMGDWTVAAMSDDELQGEEGEGPSGEVTPHYTAPPDVPEDVVFMGESGIARQAAFSNEVAWGNSSVGTYYGDGVHVYTRQSEAEDGTTAAVEPGLWPPVTTEFGPGSETESETLDNAAGLVKGFEGSRKDEEQGVAEHRGMDTEVAHLPRAEPAKPVDMEALEVAGSLLLCFSALSHADQALFEADELGQFEHPILLGETTERAGYVPRFVGRLPEPLQLLAVPHMVLADAPPTPYKSPRGHDITMLNEHVSWLLVADAMVGVHPLKLPPAKLVGKKSVSSYTRQDVRDFRRIALQQAQVKYLQKALEEPAHSTTRLRLEMLLSGEWGEELEGKRRAQPIEKDSNYSHVISKLVNERQAFGAQQQAACPSMGRSDDASHTDSQFLRAWELQAPSATVGLDGAEGLTYNGQEPSPSVYMEAPDGALDAEGPMPSTWQSNTPSATGSPARAWGAFGTWPTPASELGVGYTAPGLSCLTHLLGATAEAHCALGAEMQVPGICSEGRLAHMRHAVASGLSTAVHPQVSAAEPCVYDVTSNARASSRERSSHPHDQPTRHSSATAASARVTGRCTESSRGEPQSRRSALRIGDVEPELQRQKKQRRSAERRVAKGTRAGSGCPQLSSNASHSACKRGEHLSDGAEKLLCRQEGEVEGEGGPQVDLGTTKLHATAVGEQFGEGALLGGFRAGAEKTELLGKFPEVSVHVQLPPRLPSRQVGCSEVSGGHLGSTPSKEGRMPAVAVGTQQGGQHGNPEQREEGLCASNSEAEAGKRGQLAGTAWGRAVAVAARFSTRMRSAELVSSSVGCAPSHILREVRACAKSAQLGAGSRALKLGSKGIRTWPQRFPSQYAECCAERESSCVPTHDMQQPWNTAVDSASAQPTFQRWESSPP
jgi:hypothetical protein